MKELLTEGNFELLNKGINKVQCLDGEIKMDKIRNRDQNSVDDAMVELFASNSWFNTDVRMWEIEQENWEVELKACFIWKLVLSCFMFTPQIKLV